jgi:hypothetical protein
MASRLKPLGAKRAKEIEAVAFGQIGCPGYLSHFAP